ncbi:MAG: FG-GAP repeat domain-containing protein [Verrucomicrobiales bacterium]
MFFTTPRSWTLLLVGLSLYPGILFGEEDLVPSFTGPEIAKLNWNTGSLRAADLNGDGLLDLALLNASDARIDLLYQLAPGQSPGSTSRPVTPDRWQPVLEDSRFERISVVTGRPMHDLVVGQFLGGNRPALAFTSDRGRLLIYRQDSDQTWAEAEDLDVGTTLEYSSTLQTADISGNGKDDIALLTSGKLVILLQSEESGTWRRRLEYTLPAGEFYGLEIADADGDGRLDILYLNSSETDRVYLRRQQPQGTFSAEERVRISGSARGLIHPLRPGVGESASPEFVYLSERTNSVEIVKLSIPSTASTAREVKSVRFSAESANPRPVGHARVDLNGSGYQDMLLADAENAQVWFFAGRAEGGYDEPVSFPSSTGIADLQTADVTGDGRPEVLTLSQRERTLGYSVWLTGGRLGLPQPLPVKGLPLAMAVLEEGARARLAVLVEEDNKRKLLVIRRAAEDLDFQVALEKEFPEITSRPRALRVVDFNQNGRQDLFVFSNEEPMRVLLQEESGSFQIFEDPQGLPAALIDRLEPTGLALIDMDGDGKEEVVLVRRRLLRALRLDSRGRVEVVQQYTADAEQSNLVGLLAKPQEQAATPPSLLLFDEGRRVLSRISPDALGVYREMQTQDLDVRGIGGVYSENDDEDLTIILPSANDFLELMPNQRAQTFEQVSRYETDLESVTHQRLAVGALLGSEHGAQVVAIDTRRTRVMEILQPPGVGAASPWTSLMHFRIFEQDPHYRGRSGANDEPHAVLLADLSGTGRLDVVLLVHDRLLVYRHQPPAGSQTQ